MANHMEKRIEEALKRIENIKDVEGYLKKEMKNDILLAVSEIRKYIKTKKDMGMGEDIINKTNKTNGNWETTIEKEEDSQQRRQLATSMDKDEKAETDSRRQKRQAPTPSGEGKNQSASENIAGESRGKEEEAKANNREADDMEEPQQSNDRKTEDTKEKVDIVGLDT